MSFSVTCQCSKTLEITAAQAGTEISCPCGHKVSVPLLSQLRQLAGQGAYEAGTIDTINRMIREGELPYGDTCAISGYPTKDSYNLYVQCESGWINGRYKIRYLSAIFSILLLPLGIIHLTLGKSLFAKEYQHRGHERGIYIPLRVRKEYHHKLHRIRSQRKLRKLLCTVPIYANLFDEFPGARVKT
jgi:hypothetical protein